MAIEIGDAAHESYKKGDPEIVTKEIARNVGGLAAGLATAKLFAAGGVVLGIETGPGALVIGFIGGIIGFTIGYYGTGAALGDYSDYIRSQ